MPGYEKVIRGLECCIESSTDACPRECPYRLECLTHTNDFMFTVMRDALERLKEQQETIVSLQHTINALNKGIAEQPELKFIVDSDGKLTPLPVQKHGHWIVSGEPPLMIKTCSECDVRFFHHPTGELERFCANCGAKMDEEVKQE